MFSEIVQGVSDALKVISDYLISLLYTDENNLSFFGSIFLAFCGISFSLFIVLKVYKIFIVRYKNTDYVDKLSNEEKTDNVDKLSNEEKTDNVVNDEHLKQDYQCVYCGSLTSSNKKNCRNCGSDEFIKVRL